ncbi:hypothetical protein GCM10007161_07230 [Ignatzschineria indica]|uniref:HTH cro/C1-type domain-containing protein n=1 Tax=Ignatzschineria indica TaxID=472583 RepID=A0A2U2ANB4_9GAMM|nr:helix-turn-helix transcriptional regulator [Ignatzschineria indica]PWD84685.1 hypothetical protein DC082_03940 [Ignatzschineria indica]GGZ78393.1 hypothetical protein GCM10007161_07230 [Ignatzschineria indica]
MDHLLESFGQRLKSERVKLSMTQSELAKELNISQMSISLYEANKSIPNLKFLYSLYPLGFNVEYLIFGENGLNQDRNFNLRSYYKKIATALDFLEQKLDTNISTETKIELIDFLLN